MNAKSTVLMIVALVCGLVSSLMMHQQLGPKNADARTNVEFQDASIPVGDSLAQHNEGLAWPPRPYKSFPNLALRNTSGNTVRLADFSGRVLLIEPVGVACKACQAFSGGHEVGGLFGHEPQPGLRSLREYTENFGKGVSLDDDNIVSIQILFYGNDGTAPTLKEAQQWAEHFSQFSPKTIVLFADESLLGRETRAMIPGFWLIDRNFLLRCEAGNSPKANLYQDLVPMIGSLL